MRRRERIETGIMCVVFVFYAILVCRILFFSRVSLSDFFSGLSTAERSINLVPFRSILDYLYSGSEVVKRFAYGNVVGNIALFVPLGTYLTVFRKDKRVLSNLLFVVLVSLCAEVIQWTWGIGAADVDDILLNSIGGCIGVLGYKAMGLILRDEKKVHTAVAILSVSGLPIVLYYLFVMKMRF